MEVQRSARSRARESAWAARRTGRGAAGRERNSGTKTNSGPPIAESSSEPTAQREAPVRAAAPSPASTGRFDAAVVRRASRLTRSSSVWTVVRCPAGLGGRLADDCLRTARGRCRRRGRRRSRRARDRRRGAEAVAVPAAEVAAAEAEGRAASAWGPGSAAGEASDRGRTPSWRQPRWSRKPAPRRTRTSRREQAQASPLLSGGSSAGRRRLGDSSVPSRTPSGP